MKSKYIPFDKRNYVRYAIDWKISSYLIKIRQIVQFIFFMFNRQNKHGFFFIHTT